MNLFKLQYENTTVNPMETLSSSTNNVTYLPYDLSEITPRFQYSTVKVRTAHGEIHTLLYFSKQGD